MATASTDLTLAQIPVQAIMVAARGWTRVLEFALDEAKMRGAILYVLYVRVVAVSMPSPARVRAMRLASPRALTATVAIAATVTAVPNPMNSVAPTPVQNRSWASAKIKTMIAPEQGRNPTATTAASPRRQPPAPASMVGSGPR